jgi:malate dehydrogenase (oxaloacetate-decarboxylating)
MAQVLVRADLFIGASASGMVTGPMVRTMGQDPIILVMANPGPEIWPDNAREDGAVRSTG